MQKIIESLKNSALRENVKIYIPSTYDVNTPIDNTPYVEMIEKELSNMFGGFTSYNAFGGYVSSEGDFIKERVTVVNAFTSELNNILIDKIISLAKRLKNDLKQECVSVEINNQLFFVE